MEEAVASVIIGSLTILTGTILIMVAMWRRMKYREMEHRERMAMIERGLAPEPDLADSLARIGVRHELHDYPSIRRSRMLSGGIAIIGFGLGLMVLIGIAAESADAAVGVGGAIIVVGLSFVVIALVQGERPQPPVRSMPPPSPPWVAPKPPDSDR